MLNYSTKQSLNLPLKVFFNTVKRVRYYKDFVPWCKDSLEMSKSHKLMTYEQIAGKFPQLMKNRNSASKIKELIMDSPNSQIKLKNFDGVITVGFNVLDFTYISNVVAIEPNIILSVTDSSKSPIFKRLESLWVMKENKAENKIDVDYNIQFEFKSFMFAHVTNLFLSFLGENIVKAFIEKTEAELKNHEQEEDKQTDLDFNEVVDTKLTKIKFESLQDRITLSRLLNKLHELKQIDPIEAEKILRVIKYNNTILRKLIFLSEMTMWNNVVQVEKIKDEIRKGIY